MENIMKQQLLGINAPAKECTDKKCPFHGLVAVKKELFRGKVVKRDSNNSATLEWFRSRYVPKYERYEIRRQHLRAHNPPCIDARSGDEVIIARTRPLSKTKNHSIIQVLHLKEGRGEPHLKESSKEQPTKKRKPKGDQDHESPQE